MSMLVLSDHRMQAHEPGPHHPESPARLRAAENALIDLTGLDIRSATPAMHEHILRVHPADYMAGIEQYRDRSGIIDGDTVLSEGSVAASWLAAGACIQAVESVVSAEFDSALALVRPPGHHAEPNRAMGFCLFSNIAIAAAHARAALGCKKILIVDWDVHHGNGTQAAFYERSDVFFFSVHQSPLYPGTGHPKERGAKEGMGYTLNVPLPAGCADPNYFVLFRDGLSEVAARFKPDLVLVSAGFDAHRDDPLAQMNLSDEGFAALCGITQDIATEHTNHGVVLVLEGGYNLDALGRSVRACAQVMMGATPPTISSGAQMDLHVLDYVKRHLEQTTWQS